nr:MFS transporter [Spirochaetales bacterium]
MNKGAPLPAAHQEFPPTLSTSEKARGRKLFRLFFSLNGISVAFLMENMLILYAIRNGVPDPLVAVLSSFVHLTMPFIIVGKFSVARIGAARTWGFGWLMRYVFAAFLITAPLISPAAPQEAVSAVILFSAFGFALFRSMGIIATTPLEGEVTTPENRGNFLSGHLLRVNASQILATLLLIIITRWTDSLRVYQIVIASACIIGIYASRILSRIPESSVPRNSAQIPLSVAIKKLWNQRRARKLLFAWGAGLISFMMVIPFMMIAVKSGYGISDSQALTFSLLLMVGGITSSLVNGIIADQTGPRPIILMNTAGMLIPAAFWAAAPTAYMPVLVGIAFFLAGFCKFGIIIGLTHYFLSSVGGNDRVGSTLFIRIFSSAAAGLSGSVLGGALLSLFEHSNAAGLDIYHYYFRIIIGILLIMLLIVRSLEKLEEWSIKNILGLLVSPRDMYALHVLKRLQTRSGSQEESLNLQKLGAIGSSIPENALRRHLESPLLSVRVNALQALGRISFSRKTEDAVLNQLTCGEYTSAWIAAEIVGKHNIARGVELLRRGLESPDAYLLGKCMVALVRLGDVQSYPKIISLFEKTDNPRIIIHGAYALSLINPAEHLSRLLRKALMPDLPNPVVDEVLTAAAAAVGSRDKCYHFLQQYNRSSFIGISEIISDFDSQIFSPKEL